MKSYSMPESFLLDQNVPARWRLLGIINGFHINGKDFYASNDWIQRQLDCSRQTVSTAVKELEDLGEIIVERNNNSNRVIHRKLQEEQGGGASQLAGGRKLNTPTPASQLAPNAVFNALSINTARASESAMQDSISSSRKDWVLTEVSESGENKPRARAKYPHSKEVFAWFPRPQQSWLALKNVQEREYAEYLWARGKKKVRGALAFLKENADMKYIPQVTKPSDLEKKWNDIVAFKKKHDL